MSEMMMAQPQQLSLRDQFIARSLGLNTENALDKGISDHLQTSNAERRTQVAEKLKRLHEEGMPLALLEWAANGGKLKLS